MGLYVTYIRINDLPPVVGGFECAISARSSRCLRVLLGADFARLRTFLLSVDVIRDPAHRALVKMLILVAVWTQANYVFEQLAKLHDVLSVQPRTRDAD